MKRITAVVKNNWMMISYFKRFAPLYFFTSTFYTIFVSFVWTVTGALSLKFIFDALEQQKSFREIISYLLFVSGLIIVRNILGCINVEYLEPTAMITVEEKLRMELFEKSAQMDLAYYETPKFYDEFVWAAEQADGKVKDVYNNYLRIMARSSEILFMGGLMIALDPVLLSFVIIAVVVGALFEKVIIKKRHEMNLEAKPIERERDYNKRVFYLKDYAKELRLSAVHETLFERFYQAATKMQEIYRRGGRKIAGYALLSSGIQEIFMTMLLLLYLAYQILETNRLSLGDFAALIYAANRLAARLRQLVGVTMRCVESSIYIEKFRKFLAYEPAIEGQPGEVVEEGVHEIRLKDVSFTYAGEKNPSLKNINMTIKPYQKIAIVGYNGAGKSTLIKLIMRLYDTNSGTIYLNGKDIKEYKTSSYRDGFGSVFQDFQIFATSLAENVVMDFAKQSEEEQIAAALDKSGFSEKLSLYDHGLDTAITKEFDEEGVNLSGGEAQKIAIARAFYKPCNYIIMDEPSSALDPISEYKMNENMMQIAKDKTVIFISHRLSSTCMADKIYMMEKGEIIEEGSHDELMALNGKYAEMFIKQSRNYKD